VEAIDNGDIVHSDTDERGLGLVPIDFHGLTRAYHNSLPGLLKPMAGTVVLQTLNPTYSVDLKYNGVAKSVTLASDVTRSPVIYDRPFDRAAWVPSNVNDDFATANRQDYSVFIAPLDLIAAGTQYDGVPTSYFHYVTTFVVGKTYTLVTLGNATQMTSTESGTNYTSPTTFVADSTTYLFYGPAGSPPLPALAITAEVTIAELYLGTNGVTCGLLQEAIAGFRIPGGQGRSFQLDITNTTGRVKLLAVRIGVVPGPIHKGILQ
jgi:hypothetical protein